MTIKIQVIKDNFRGSNILVNGIHGSKGEEIRDHLGGPVEVKGSLMGKELVEVIFRICSI